MKKGLRPRGPLIFKEKIGMKALPDEEGIETTRDAYASLGSV